MRYPMTKENEYNSYIFYKLEALEECEEHLSLYKEGEWLDEDLELPHLLVAVMALDRLLKIELEKIQKDLNETRC